MDDRDRTYLKKCMADIRRIESERDWSLIFGFALVVICFASWFYTVFR